MRSSFAIMRYKEDKFLYFVAFIAQRARQTGRSIAGKREA